MSIISISLILFLLIFFVILRSLSQQRASEIKNKSLARCELGFFIRDSTLQIQLERPNIRIHPYSAIWRYCLFLRMLYAAILFVYTSSIRSDSIRTFYMKHCQLLIFILILFFFYCNFHIVSLWSLKKA